MRLDVERLFLSIVGLHLGTAEGAILICNGVDDVEQINRRDRLGNAQNDFGMVGVVLHPGKRPIGLHNHAKVRHAAFPAELTEYALAATPE